MLNKKLAFGIVVLLCISIALDIYQAVILSGNIENTSVETARTYTHCFEWWNVTAALTFTEEDCTLTVTANVTAKHGSKLPRSMCIVFDMNGDGQLTGDTYIYDNSTNWQYFSFPDLIIFTDVENQTSTGASIVYNKKEDKWDVALCKHSGPMKHRSIYCIRTSETSCTYHIVSITKPKTDLVFLEIWPCYTPLFHYKGGNP